MNTINCKPKPSGFMGAVTLPWDALHEFGRMICLGYRRFEELLTGDASDRSQTRSQCVNAIPADARGLPHEAYTPPPGEAFYEFAFLVSVGFAVPFRPRRACVGEDRRPKVEARQRVTRFTESVPDSNASVDDRVPAGCAQ
jgi:hypothetical protein